MFIKTIHLRNFRNYKEQYISLSSGTNIFYGQNAQGKTNVIESIYLSSTGRSHRTNRDNELIKWNENECRIKIEYDKENIEGNIDINIKENCRKQIKVNCIRLNKTADLLGNLNTVIFSPDHMKIIKDGPLERRRFIDIILSQVKPEYYYNLTQYVKVLEQRNKLLNDIKKGRAKDSTLDIWDDQLLEYGSKIIKTRKAFIKKINSLSEVVHSKITDGSEKLHILYKPSVEGDDNDIENIFRKDIEKSRKIDIKTGITHKGPQRDDLIFSINGKEAKIYGSQGQQRTSLLALKLSELQYINLESGTLPVLLLDDVFSELDTKRQNFLMKYIDNIQTIITCTDVQYFKKSDIIESKLFNVHDGCIVTNK